MKIKNSSNVVLNSSSPEQEQTHSISNEQTAQHEFVSSKASLAARAYASPQISSPSFGCHYEKVINMIKNAPNPAKVHLSYEEVCNVLDHLGYTFRHHNGSHVIASIPNGQPLTIVYTHGHHKFVDPGTISDLKKILKTNHELSKAS